ncbi:MAG: M1 family metallopeptidase [Chitinophagales bacterium]|nr:M1 family metallopeptidase [Chitinophagales bacterium]
MQKPMLSAFKIAAVSLFIAASLTISAQAYRQCYLKDPGGSTREHNFDVQHILLDVRFSPKEGKVMGTVEHTFSPLQKDVDTLFLDAPSINIQQVLLDKQAVKFDTTKEGLIVRFPKTLHWDEKHVLTIQYEATPRKGIYFIGWNDPNNLSRKQIWTQGQGIDNRYWIPSFDDMNDKATTEVKVAFDKAYKVLSNGELLEQKEQKDGTKLWHYKMTNPHASYLIMLAIGNYEVRTSKSKSGVVINNWYYPEYPETVEPTYRYTEQMMDYLESETGLKYPWHAYSQVPVQDFMFGAMENTTATIFGDFYIIDKRAYLDRNYIGTNAHEMTHQWFGDYVTARSNAHTWLQESFATHYAKGFERSIFGEDHYQWNRRGELNSVLDAAKNNNNPIAHSNAGSPRIYPKGSLVLDMLKYVVGEEQYKRALLAYLKKHPYGNVDTHDFYRAFLDNLGIELDWFFDQWIYRGGEPRYEVSYVPSKDKTVVTVKQTQTDDGVVGLFKMPIVFEVVYKDGSSSTVKEWIQDAAQTVNVPNPSNKEIDFVLFDPNSQIIKSVKFEKGLEEFRSQALKAKNMIDRYDALLALSNLPFNQRKDILIAAFAKEPFWANRAEIAKQLAQNIDSIDQGLIKNMLKDGQPRVRQSVLDNTSKVPQGLLADYEVLLTDSSYWIVENSLVKLSAQYPQNIARYLETTKDVKGIGNKVRVAWLEIAAGLDRSKYLPQLVEYGSNSYEFRSRGYAFAALTRLDYLDNKLLDYLTDAALSSNTRLSGPAVTALNYYKSQTAYKKMMQDYYCLHTWKDWQKEVLKPVMD